MTKFVVRMAGALALAAMASTAHAAVFTPQQQLQASTIDAFKSNPSQLLQQFPQGGAALISRVRDLAASDPTTLPLLIDLLKSADPKTQIPAIAAGLAQVARLASKTDQAYATEIQNAIGASGNQVAIAAYQAATGDVAIAATGGGGGAGGGGTGGGGPTGSGGFVFGGNNSGSAQTIGGLHSATLTTGQASGGVGGTTVSVSPIR